MLNFNDAPQNTGDLIPQGTKARIIMHIRPGQKGPEGWCTESKSGSLMLDCEFTLMTGQYAKRKFWQYFVLEGNETAMNISRQNLRAIIESARNIRPDDYSDQAVAIRNIPSLGALDGLEFAGKISVEKGKDGWEDKNKLGGVITPDMKDYQPVMDGTNTNAAQVNHAPQAKAPVQTAAWAKSKAPVNEPKEAPKSNIPAWAMPAAEPAQQQSNDLPF